ncbi:hypothetical protein [Chthonobacter albigriseus]|uniref:hypothetical protein n=1 Tax=Chthonobacter albigriseus TaxID=1683161 RepID=UPI0015EF2B99|nr:hypothetical protein [Chthonobacter albigriseus]
MSTVSLSASYARSTSLSVTASAPEDGAPAENVIPKSDPVADMRQKAHDDAKVIRRLDKALEFLRDDKPALALKVYNRLGRMDKDNDKDTAETSLSLQSAEMSRTEISIDADGIEITRSSFSYANLETDDASASTLSLNVSRAYIGFGNATGKAADRAA